MYKLDLETNEFQTSGTVDVVHRHKTNRFCILNKSDRSTILYFFNPEIDNV